MSVQCTVYRPAVSQDAELYLGCLNEFLHTLTIFAFRNNLLHRYAIHNVNDIKIAKLAKLSKKRKNTTVKGVVRWYCTADPKI